MADFDTNSELETAKPTVCKKCCSGVKNFFTKEAEVGQRVLNWKFWLLAVIVVAIVFII